MAEWHEKDGVIYFDVVSDGTSGRDWITRLEKSGCHVGYYAEAILNPKYIPPFKPSTGLTYRVVVLKGILFKDENRTTRNIRIEAKSRKLTTPNIEIACLIREKFTDEELGAMGLAWIEVMHEPIRIHCVADLLNVFCIRGWGGGRWLHGCHDIPGFEMAIDIGFAFVASSEQKKGEVMSMTTFRLRNPQMTNQEIADALGLDSTYFKQLPGTVDACLLHVFSAVASRRGELLSIHGKWVFNTTNLEMRELCEAARKFADRV